MKKALLIILVVSFYVSGNCQEASEKKTDTLLKELSENSCKCVDSIDTRNKTKEEISIEVSKCIDNQTEAYQISSILTNIDLLTPIEKDGKKEINININTKKDSKEYKEYYFKIERYMMNNCQSMKSKIASNDIENYFSVSKNPKAKKMYSKGIRQSENGNYKRAITYFEKALKIDSLFAFAWDNIGICNRKLNNYDEAIYAYNKSLELDPLGLMPLQNIAVAYEYKKEYDKAIKAYQSLEELDSQNPEVYYGIGRVYAFFLNDFEKGLDNICKAYNLYIKIKSPYRTDAEKLINSIYTEMKKDGKTDKFDEILKENNINADFR